VSPLRHPAGRGYIARGHRRILVQSKVSYTRLPSIRRATEYRHTTVTPYLVVAFRTYSGTLPISPRTWAVLAAGFFTRMMRKKERQLLGYPHTIHKSTQYQVPPSSTLPIHSLHSSFICLKNSLWQKFCTTSYQIRPRVQNKKKLHRSSCPYFFMFFYCLFSFSCLTFLTSFSFSQHFQDSQFLSLFLLFPHTSCYM
jgi:hypothetical protein